MANIIHNGLNNGEIPASELDDILSQIREHAASCGQSQTGFNLLHIFVTPAYAQETDCGKVTIRYQNKKGEIVVKEVDIKPGDGEDCIKAFLRITEEFAKEYVPGGQAGSKNRPPVSGPKADKTLNEITATITGNPVHEGTSGSAYLDSFLGKSVGLTVQCVALVQFFAPELGLTKTWVQGAAAFGNGTLQPGTPIATFVGPGNTYNGGSYQHAAIYLGQTADGILVMDQWDGQIAHVRLIRNIGVGRNAASSYFVIK